MISEATTGSYIFGRGQRFRIWTSSSWRRLKRSWSVYSSNKLGVLGLAIFILFTLMAIIHPVLMNTVWSKGIYDPVVGHDIDIFPHPAPPSTKHLLGTDTLGRDVFSVLLAAARPTYVLAITAALMTAIVGTLIGAISAFYRGFVDGFFSHLSDVALLAPAPLVMIVIGFVLNISALQFGVIYGLIAGAGGVAIVMRAHAITLVSKSYMEAARVAGGGSLYVITRHLIPHMLPLAAVNMMLTVTGAVFASGFIAFLGLSRAQLNWGSMIYDSFTYLAINGQITWNVLIPSALAISLFAASFYMMARGLQDVADPRKADQRMHVPLSTVEDPVYAESAVTLHPEPNVETAVKGVPLVAHPGLVDEATMTQPTKRLVMTILFAELHSRSTEGYSLKTKEGLLFGNIIESMLPIIREHDGYLRRLDGNGFVVSFGNSLKKHPPQVSSLLAIHAGLEVMGVVQEIKETSVDGNLQNVNIGIGIATGPVCTQELKNPEIDTLENDEVIFRVAHQLLYFTRFMESGGMLISEGTYLQLKKVRDHFEFGRKGPVSIPEVTDSMMAYEVIGRDSPLITREKWES